MKKYGKTLLLLFASLLVTASSALATVSLPALFSDHMVLQRDVAYPLWGKADPGEQFTISIGNFASHMVANTDGSWKCVMPALKVGGPYTLTIAGAANTLVIHDVLAGEVWVASGQSNMTFPLAGAINGKAEVDAANYPQIRVFTVADKVAATPQRDCSGSWQLATPENAASFTALGYLFARDIYQALGATVPVGIIHSAVGGTTAQAWTRTEIMPGNPDLEPILHTYQTSLDEYQKALAAYPGQLAAWNAAVKQAAADGKPAPQKPAAPQDPSTQTARPGGLFYGKIAPLIPYRIRGVIWWQGEYNANWAEQYGFLFPALIRDWRAQWGQGDFPFLFVQLENLIIAPHSEAHYDELRESQLKTWQTVPQTGMVVMCDIGDPNNIHPANKQGVAQRMSLIALNTVYGKKNIIYSGPVYKGMKIDGGKIRLSFTFLGGGLVSKSGNTLGSFEIAGADKHFVPANAVIDGDTVLVFSPDIKAPLAVRYAWADNPTCTLYNKADLPATPFRTDSWPVCTTGIRK